MAKRRQDRLDDEHEQNERAEQERRRKQTEIQRMGLSWPDPDPEAEEVEQRVYERPAEPQAEEKKPALLTITIYDDGKRVSAFPAPSERFPAIELWAFLVANLRPGLNVRLSGGKRLDVTRSSGATVPPELYRELMLG